MDWLLAALAVFNVVSMFQAFKPRTFAADSAPWFTFVFALPATELSWIWLPLQALIALLLVAGGALHSTLGTIALLVLFVSWAGLALSIYQSLRSEAPVEDALLRALGADYRAAIPPEIGARLRREVRFDHWRHPFRMKRPDVEVIRDLSYGPGGIKQKFDIYRPVSIPEEGCPVLLQIHGGAWMIGDKERQALPLMHHVAANGWICVAINYRLSPSVSFPTHLVDCKSALCWIRTRGREYGMNPDFVAVTGGSAGGHLTALMGLTANRADLQTDHPDVDTTVQACVPFYGVYDFTNRDSLQPGGDRMNEFLEKYVMHRSLQDDPGLWDLASPISQVREDAPPFMIVHGERDSLAPVSMARLFSQRLRAVSANPVAYLELQGAEHAFELVHSPRTEYTIDGVHRFLEWVRARA
jgi:acetyl esterase/lipase